MTPPNEYGGPGRWDSADIAELRVEVLNVMADVVQWRLSEARWLSIEQTLDAMNAAAARGDVGAFANATADLELAGPVRIVPITSTFIGPTPRARDLMNRLLYTLGGVAPGGQEPQKNQEAPPKDDAGAGDADTSPS